MLAIIVGGVGWYLNRPKPWDNRAIKVAYSNEIYSTLSKNFDISGMELEYLVENTTPEDYTLSSTQDTFMILEKGEMRKSTSGLYKVRDSCFIPSRTKIKCSIEASPNFDTSAGIDGFVVFDTVKRFRIDFPKPTTPTPEEKRKAIATFKKFRPDDIK